MEDVALDEVLGEAVPDEDSEADDECALKGMGVEQVRDDAQDKTLPTMADKFHYECAGKL